MVRAQSSVDNFISDNEDEELCKVIQNIVDYIKDNCKSDKNRASMMDYIMHKARLKLKIIKIPSSMSKACPLGCKNKRIYANVYNNTRKVHGKTYKDLFEKAPEKRHSNIIMATDSEDEEPT